MEQMLQHLICRLFISYNCVTNKDGIRNEDACHMQWVFQSGSIN